jgi:hypothetical protein
MSKAMNWRVDNAYPIVISFITMVLAVSALYWGLSNKIDLLTQKVEYRIRELQVLHTSLKVAVAQCCPSYK